MGGRDQYKQTSEVGGAQAINI